MARARDDCGKFLKEHGMKGTKIYNLLYRINNGYSIEKALEKGDNRYGKKKRIV